MPRPRFAALLLAALACAVPAAAQRYDALQPDVRNFVSVSDDNVALVNVQIVDGTGAAPPRNLTDSADALRQTAADFMQLVWEIQSGIDVDAERPGGQKSLRYSARTGDNSRRSESKLLDVADALKPAPFHCAVVAELERRARLPIRVIAQLIVDRPRVCRFDAHDESLGKI